MTAVMAARVTELQSGVDAVKGVVDKLPAMKWSLDKNAFTRLKQELDKLVLIDKVSTCSFVFSLAHTRTHAHTHTHARTHTHTGFFPHLSGTTFSCFFDHSHSGLQSNLSYRSPAFNGYLSSTASLFLTLCNTFPIKNNHS
jgi:hypothetical protein